MKHIKSDILHWQNDEVVGEVQFGVVQADDRAHAAGFGGVLVQNVKGGGHRFGGVGALFYLDGIECAVLLDYEVYLALFLKNFAVLFSALFVLAAVVEHVEGVVAPLVAERLQYLGYDERFKHIPRDRALFESLSAIPFGQIARKSRIPEIELRRFDRARQVA